MSVERAGSTNINISKQLSGYHKDWNSAEYIEKKGIFKDHLSEIKGQLETREKTIYEIIDDYGLYYSFVKKELIAFCEPNQPGWYKDTISSQSSIHKESARDRLKQLGKDHYKEIKQLLAREELKETICTKFEISLYKLNKLLKKHHYQKPIPVVNLVETALTISLIEEKILSEPKKVKIKKQRPPTQPKKPKEKTVKIETKPIKIQTNYTWSDQRELFKIIEDNRVARLNLSRAK